MITFLLAIFLFPADALAWGPATHLELGASVLNNLGSVAPGIAALIGEFRYDFLYGNISADIVVGKNLAEELKHCHNWRFGKRLLSKAASDSQRAFAYGYLAHLAADTVAHNRFIPEMMVRSFSTRITRHIYWELRFDALADRDVWRIPPMIERSVHLDNDGLLASALEDTPLSFGTNKTIFSSIINLHGIKRWHRMLDLLSAASRWSLERDVRECFFSDSFDAAMDVLSRLDAAACIHDDPTGRKNLMFARRVRRELKALKRNRRNWPGHMERALRRLSPPPRL